MKFMWLSILLCLFIASCDRPDCTNNNPIFRNYPPENQIYKNELSRSISRTDKNELRFWFKEIKQLKDRKELQFNIQNENICAVISMEFPQIYKLKNLIEKNGKSFHGAEFKNLKFKTIQENDFIRFMLIDFDYIID